MNYTAKQLAQALIDVAEKKNIKASSDALVAWLQARGELRRVREVIDAVETIWKHRFGAATVTIRSAHQISTTLRKRIETLAPGAELHEFIDAELVGGARIRIDDRVIDASVEGYLEQLHETLSTETNL